MAVPRKYSNELREPAVQLHFESEPRPVVRRLAEQLGVHPRVLRTWITRPKADCGQRDDMPTIAEVEELRRLR